MRDLIWKLGVLRTMLHSTVEEWQREIWRCDPDDPYCCPGGRYDECACGGVTLRELYTDTTEEPTR